MVNILFKLDDFCAHNNIAYCVTGTMALKLLGVPMVGEPGDIDILVFNCSEDLRNKLAELQYLAGIHVDTYYEGTCYSFFVDGCKINAIITTKETSLVTLNMFDESKIKQHTICVQTFSEAIKAKKKLRRLKDYRYIQYLIHKIQDL